MDDEERLKDWVREGELLVASTDSQKKFLDWTRDINSKLYYNLWILFMGGFVFSLSTSDKYHVPHSWEITFLVHLFRVLAIVGTVLNFYLPNFHGQVRITR